jgi:hypothetical protein
MAIFVAANLQSSFHIEWVCKLIVPLNTKFHESSCSGALVTVVSISLVVLLE